MLIGNYSVLQKSPTRFLAGSTSSVEGQVRSNFSKSGMSRNRMYPDRGSAALPYYAVPNGYYPPATWFVPQKSGGIGSINAINGTGGVTSGNLAGGLNAEAALTGAGDITSAVGQLVISMLASLTGSGEITSSDLRAFLNAVASLTGGGDLAGTATGLGFAVGDISGSGSVAATPFATGAMAANIVVAGDALTTSNVASAVWDAIASENDVPGSMGEKLNDAGGASNPWTETLPGAYVAGSAGYILGNQLANILSGMGERLIEDGWTQDQVTRIMLAALAGERQGLGTATESYLSQDGLLTRISLTPDANGNGIPIVDGS